MKFESYFILKNKLYTFIKNNVLNKEYIRSIIQEFTKKNLNVIKINKIFSLEISLDELSIEELVAITKCTYNYTRDKSFNPQNNFDKNILANYESYINVEDNLKEIVLNNIIKIDDYNYIGRISFEQVYNYINNGLIIYNKKSQRAGKLRKIGKTGGYIRDISLNMDSIKDMSNLMSKGKFEENEIILGVTIGESEEDPDIRFIPKVDNYGTLIIKPNYDTNSTVVSALDGYHRIQASMDAYLNSGKKLNYGFDVRIVVRTLEEAKEIVYQTFKRSDTEWEHLETYNQDSNYMQFVNNIEKYSRVLNGNLADTYEDCMIEDKMTYKTLLINTIKFLNINVNSISIRKTLSKNMAEKIDELYYGCKINNHKIFVLYAIIAYSETNVVDYINRINSISETAIKITENKSKNVNIKEIADLYYSIKEDDNGK